MPAESRPSAHALLRGAANTLATLPATPSWAYDLRERRYRILGQLYRVTLDLGPRDPLARVDRLLLRVFGAGATAGKAVMWATEGSGGGA